MDAHRVVETYEICAERAGDNGLDGHVHGRRVHRRDLLDGRLHAREAPAGDDPR